MAGKVVMQTPEGNRFESIEDFVRCMEEGGEVRFLWKDRAYGIVRYGVGSRITVYEAYNPDSQVSYDSAAEALTYMAGEDRLGDIIARIRVTFRSA